MMLAYRPFSVHAALGLILVTGAGFGIGCSSASPTAPQPAGGTPAAAERRVDAVGGGEGECIEGECPPRPPGAFTLVVPNGETLTGIRSLEAGWAITGGTGRYASAGGTATFQPLSGSIAVTFNFGLMHPSPPVYTEGTLVFVNSTDNTSPTCSSGVITTDTYRGALESFGRVELQLELCAD